MIIKTRSQSIELQSYELLNKRMNLAEQDKQYFNNLKKGHDGERMFDTLIEKLQCDCLVINDLLLTTNNTTYQIDSLLIMPDAIYLFEVKNFEGDFYYQSNRFYKRPKAEMVDPLIQLKRTESLFDMLLQKLGFNIPINAWIVFINSEFTLYQAPLDSPIIFPTQINRFLKNLDRNTSKITQKHRALAEKLVSLHIQESPYKQLPTYEYAQLQKGISCKMCGGISVLIEGKTCICTQCGQQEPVESAVLRSVKEFKQLFPNERITTNVIFDWCRVVKSKRRINRILSKHYKIIGTHQWAYYE
ncbi:nuclease-related domain-containing protein [Lysinibacillus endophyticus]|uniref:nuclease-related domain-containing protein n=1 Tax=Ureibacillus endophyticus TaxID=1978490 RepID=UPI003135D4CA